MSRSTESLESSEKRWVTLYVFCQGRRLVFGTVIAVGTDLDIPLNPPYNSSAGAQDIVIYFCVKNLERVRSSGAVCG